MVILSLLLASSLMHVEFEGQSYIFPDDATQEEVVQALNAQSPDIAAIKEELAAANKRYKLPDGLLTNIAQAESGFRPEIITGKEQSSKGALGLMQFMPKTAKQYEVDPLDPTQAIDGAGRYMQALIKQFDGDVTKAVASYNWGVGNVQRRGLEQAPKETVDYVGRVLGIDIRQLPVQEE